MRRLSNRTYSIKYHVYEIRYCVVNFPVSIVSFVWELVKLITVHPVMWCWYLFQIEFVIDYYIRKEYHNMKRSELLWFNLRLNSPKRRAKTFRNKIFRWSVFKIFERNNYTYNPNLTRQEWIDCLNAGY